MFLLVSLALVVPAAALWGWAATLLWAWFVTPIWGVPSPQLWVLAGLIMSIRFIAPVPYVEDGRSTSDKLIYGIVHSIVSPMAALGFGWIYHSFAQAPA